jgi:hypothetical protein
MKFDDGFSVVDPILIAFFGTISEFAPELAIITGIVIVGALSVKDAARIFWTLLVMQFDDGLSVLIVVVVAVVWCPYW